MTVKKISLSDEMENITEAYKPLKLISVSNRAWVELSMHLGPFPLGMHYHENDDELFICIEGEVEIKLENDASVFLKKGEMLHVKAGQKHLPFAKNPCYLIRIKTSEHLPAKF